MLESPTALGVFVVLSVMTALNLHEAIQYSDEVPSQYVIERYDD